MLDDHSDETWSALIDDDWLCGCVVACGAWSFFVRVLFGASSLPVCGFGLFVFAAHDEIEVEVSTAWTVEKLFKD